MNDFRSEDIVLLEDFLYYIEKCDDYIFETKMFLEEKGKQPIVDENPIFLVKKIFNNVITQGNPTQEKSFSEFVNTSHYSKYLSNIDDFSIIISQNDLDRLERTFYDIYSGKWDDIDTNDLDYGEDILKIIYSKIIGSITILEE